MKIVKTVCCVVGAICLTGCCTMHGYLTDRAHDASDVITATVGIGVGAKVRAGPVQAALLYNVDQVGLRAGKYFCAALGDDPTLEVYSLFPFPYSELGPAGNFGVEVPATILFEGDKRGKGFAAYSPFPCIAVGADPEFYTQIEVAIGLGLSTRLGFNPGEFLDFLLGWVGIDIYNDDLNKKRKDAPE